MVEEVPTNAPSTPSTTIKSTIIPTVQPILRRHLCLGFDAFLTLLREADDSAVRKQDCEQYHFPLSKRRSESGMSRTSRPQFAHWCRLAMHRIMVYRSGGLNHATGQGGLWLTASPYERGTVAIGRNQS